MGSQKRQRGWRWGTERFIRLVQTWLQLRPVNFKAWLGSNTSSNQNRAITIDTAFPMRNKSAGSSVFKSPCLDSMNLESISCSSLWLWKFSCKNLSRCFKKWWLVGKELGTVADEAELRESNHPPWLVVRRRQCHRELRSFCHQCQSCSFKASNPFAEHSSQISLFHRDSQSEGSGRAVRAPKQWPCPLYWCKFGLGKCFGFSLSVQPLSWSSSVV